MGIDTSLLAKVRALLAKAEDPSYTEAEAEALTAKATELMAKYGIEAAVLADAAPDTDTPTNKIVTVENPRAMEKARLLQNLADVMRCKAVRITPRKGQSDGRQRVHVFGYSSDLERVDVLYTSLLLQMMNGLAKVRVPRGVSARTYRRSWMIGFRSKVAERVAAIEKAAADEAAPTSGRSTELVLADRAAVVERELGEVYPSLRSSRSYYLPDAYDQGQKAGARADIGQARMPGARPALSR